MANSPYDVIIIGSGPAGLSAAVYAARAGMKTLLLENYDPSPQAALTDVIENFPGFPEGIKGFELLEKIKKQSEKFGAEIKPALVKNIITGTADGKRIFRVTAGDSAYESLSVVIAAGAKFKKLGVDGEDRLAGRGVSYCAICDAALFKGKEIISVGGGDSALQETLFLAKFAKKITLIHRRDRLRAAKILQEKIFADPKIKFVPESVIEKISGADKTESVTVKNIKTGGIAEIACDGVFIFAGWTPNTEFIKGFVDTAPGGYIPTDAAMRTSADGVFACGDCRVTPLRQIVTACADGAVAAHSAQQYTDKLKGTEYK